MTFGMPDLRVENSESGTITVGGGVNHGPVVNAVNVVLVIGGFPVGRPYNLMYLTDLSCCMEYLYRNNMFVIGGID